MMLNRANLACFGMGIAGAILLASTGMIELPGGGAGPVQQKDELQRADHEYRMYLCTLLEKYEGVEKTVQNAQKIQAELDEYRSTTHDGVSDTIFKPWFEGDVLEAVRRLKQYEVGAE